MAVIRPTGYLSHYGFSPEETEEHLEHYGVKGMKWGKHLKAKITDLSDKYITGKSAKEEYEKALRDRDDNLRNKTISDIDREDDLRNSEARANNAATLTKKANRSTQKAAVYDAAARVRQRKYDKLYGDPRDMTSEARKDRKRNAQMLESIKRSIKYNKKEASIFGTFASSDRAEARFEKKKSDELKQNAAASARKSQGYMNAANAANAKAASAKRRYDKSLAGKIETGKKIAKYLVKAADSERNEARKAQTASDQSAMRMALLAKKKKK